MVHKVNNQKALPFQELQMPHHAYHAYHVRVPQPNRVSDDDFPAQSSFHLSGVRMVALSGVFLGVTLSMLASFVFLFSGAPVRLLVPVLPFPSWSLIGLTAAGGGVGILLWVALTSLFKHQVKGRSAQQSLPLPRMSRFATDRSIVLPSEPVERHTDALSSSAWKVKPLAQWRAEKRETVHLRQRLRTLRLYGADEFPWDDDDENPRYPIKDVNGRMCLQRKTDALLSQDRQRA
ncbi:hypothetical protein ccbrp13_21200 [Ktedonobacteria bacterium brp13]|nr:hypothetical protein ccbrp13_21200 [Ktedonobacteria bacterium brp13]